jgi:hypothetical protein
MCEIGLSDFLKSVSASDIDPHICPSSGDVLPLILLIVQIPFKSEVGQYWTNFVTRLLFFRVNALKAEGSTFSECVGKQRNVPVLDRVATSSLVSCSQEQIESVSSQ